MRNSFEDIINLIFHQKLLQTIHDSKSADLMVIHCLVENYLYVKYFIEFSAAVHLI